ncbi:nucleotidyltransferase family protein [Rhodococcus sp. IEGM 1381]|uniref:nucleotidyltransferase family protein n=1 Tax=Rhodococcus sp. IEGM 1381 TaxID=3047085 RepID=UPI0024B81D42|nr:nucleotidyltransferase family protein [Rhodococcus sp. IEGM 1381]MDI9894215.1 nucleotidyltransferase family protein [Rhodococcus sp. IEGM 1381]
MTSPARSKRAARDLLLETMRAGTAGQQLPEVPSALEPNFVECTLRSGLGSVIAHTMHAQGSSVPAGLAESIRPVAANHLLHLAVLNLVRNVLTTADVRWLVFKGPAVAEALYEVPSARAYSDIDILIHPADFERGLEALLDGPARLIDQNWSLISERDQGEITLAVGSTVIDLHWHFFSSAATRTTFALDIRRTFDHAISTKLGGVEMTTLDPIDTMIFLATHAILSGGHRLKWMYDFHRAANALEASRAEVDHRMREHNVELIVSVMASRTAAFLDGDAPITHVHQPWLALSRLACKAAPPESEYLNAYTGRALFSATRTTTTNSAAQFMRNAFRLVRTGSNRRSHVVDRSILHLPGGTEADRRRWLDMVASHG